MKKITNVIKIALLCLFLIGYNMAQAQSPVFYLKYDEKNGKSYTTEEVSETEFSITNQSDKPERVKGVENNALRTDGFSTWAHGNLDVDFDGQMAIETWVALESYPSDEEVPYSNLTSSAIVSQINGDKGFQFGINTFGDWWFTVNINGQKYTCKAPKVFPLYEWVYIAAVVDSDAGKIRLYLNGKQVSEKSIPQGGTIEEGNVPLYIGKSNTDKTVGIFLINALNAAIDETQIYDSIRNSDTILSIYKNGKGMAKTTGYEALKVPDSRFADDLQRPLYHALPPANWTNEPHGFVKYNGNYHLFYQRTPNGPYKFQMHWGHMMSNDFANWYFMKDALWPSLEWSETTGYDMKGIWSGDVVIENNQAYAFYTCVNHSGSFNPGIALATSNDSDLETWDKQGPVIDKTHVDDFRDPYLWKEGGTWHMIIGARINGHGGLSYYTSQDLTNWTYQQQFSSVTYEDMDIGSAIWEMPVFEPIGNGKHVLVVSPIGGDVGKYGPDKYTRSVYWIGDWQNGTFTPDFTQPKKLDLIHGHLSPTVVRNNADSLVAIGIVDERRSSQAQLNAGWTHLYSLPRKWTLLDDNQTLGQSPVESLKNLRITDSENIFSNISVNGTHSLAIEGSESMEIKAHVDPTTSASEYGLNLRVSPDDNEITKLYYDVDTEEIVLDKTSSSLSNETEENSEFRSDYDVAAFGKPETFHIYIDHSVIDVFINDKAAFSNRIYPTREDSDDIELYASGNTNFTSIETWQLKQAIGNYQPSVVLKTDSSIIEGEEDGAEFYIHLSGSTFAQNVKKEQWEMKNQPNGVSIDTIMLQDDKTALVKLEGNATNDYDEDIKNFELYISSSAFTDNISQDTIKADGIVFTAIHEPKTTILLSGDTLIHEGKEAGKEVIVSVENNRFIDSLDTSNWSVSNLPPGISYKLEAIDSLSVKITLTGNADDYDEDLTGFKVSVHIDEFANSDPEIHTDSVTVSSGVTFLAISDMLKFDFETGDLSKWIVSGNAFSDEDVTSDTAWGWGGPFNHHGKFHLWSFKDGGDEETGAIQTDSFTLGKDGKIDFLIGGGNDISNLYIALVRNRDDSVLMKATGGNDEAYTQKSFDATDYIGETCYIKVVDNSTGEFGHINVDHIRIPVLAQPSSSGMLTIYESGVDHKQVAVNLYPNPAGIDDHITIEIKNTGMVRTEYELMTLSGRSIQNGRMINKVHKFKLPSNNLLNKGVYLIKVSGLDFCKTRRLIVK